MRFSYILNVVKTKPTSCLVIGYCIGQGGCFLLQAGTKFLNYHELTGLFVLIISLFSFCYQFSDLGNSTYLVKKILTKNFFDVYSYLKYRAYLAFAVCFLYSIYLFYHDDTYIELIPYLYVLPFLAFLSARFKTAFLESSGNYFLLAISNSIIWVCFALSLTLYFIFNSHIVGFIISFFLLLLFFIANFYFDKILNYSVGKNYDSEIISHENGMLRAIQFVFPPLGGQIWGRLVLFYIAHKYGLSILGEYGLIKYIQIFIVLMLGFITRPRLRGYIKKIEFNRGVNKVNIREYNFYQLVRHYGNYLYISMLGPAVFVFITTYIYIDSGVFNILNNWSLVLCITPFVVISQACVSLNQLEIKSGCQIIMDHVGLLSNIVIFIYLIDDSAPLAIFLGELSQYLVNIILYYATRKFIFLRFALYEDCSRF